MKTGTFIILFLCLLSLNCEGPQGPAGPAGSESLTDPRIQPKVIYTYPPMNSQGPYEFLGYSVEIRFNKIMDGFSLRKTVHLSSPLNDVIVDTNIYYFQDREIIHVAARRVDEKSGYRWKINQVYTLTIDTNAKDINGNRLFPEFRMTFKPEPYFRVKYIYPSNDATDVYPLTTISLTFNSEVDTSIFSAIQLSPPVPGRWRFQERKATIIDSTYISYSTDGVSLSTNTTYTLTIEDTVHDKHGNRIREKFTSSFTTLPFRVTSTSPYHGSTNVPPKNSWITIRFSDALDTSTIQRSFGISPQLLGLFRISDGARDFTFNSIHGLTPNTVYTVIIDTTLRSMSGVRQLTPYQFSFTTAPFRVDYTSPWNGQTDVYPFRSVDVSFNSEIDTSSVRSAFQISPDIAGLFRFSEYGDRVTFSPLEPLLLNTTYTVTISTTMQSIGGSNLSLPYSFSFTTSPFEVATTTPPNGYTRVSRSNSIRFSFTSTIDTNSVPAAFNISPVVNGTFTFPVPAVAFYFSPNELLAPLTIYTVTLDTTLSSTSGDRLKSPYQLVFATGN